MDKLEVFDCEQGSDEWRECRRGVVTASNFASVMAKGEGKTRMTYMRKLAGEIITGEIMPSYSNAAMERGHEMEQEAVDKFAFIHGVDPQTVGFMRRGRLGASPDRIISDTVIMEVKSKEPYLLIECLERGSLPPEHKAQVMGQMYVAGAITCHFVAYWPGMPLFHVSVERDTAYIDSMLTECNRFVNELDALVEKVRNYQ